MKTKKSMPKKTPMKKGVKKVKTMTMKSKKSK